MADRAEDTVTSRTCTIAAGPAKDCPAAPVAVAAALVSQHRTIAGLAVGAGADTFAARADLVYNTGTAIHRCAATVIPRSALITILGASRRITSIVII